jgi:hypothetical protein
VGSGRPSVVVVTRGRGVRSGGGEDTKLELGESGSPVSSAREVLASGARVCVKPAQSHCISGLALELPGGRVLVADPGICTSFTTDMVSTAEVRREVGVDGINPW